MGYSHYLYAIPKKQVAEIQGCKTNKDWVDFAKRWGYIPEWAVWDDDYFSPSYIDNKLYELGKYSEIGHKLEAERPSVFTSDELKQMYADYGFALLTKDDFKAIIDSYRQNIVNWFDELLHPEEPEEGEEAEETQSEKWKKAIQSKLDAWSGKNFGLFPFDLDENKEAITTSWCYEYAIFELVRLYKVFDWENNDLVLIGC